MSHSFVICSAFIATVVSLTAEPTSRRSGVPASPLNPNLVRPTGGLRFEPNVGQADSAAQFVARGEGYAMALSGDGAVLSLAGVSNEAPAANVRLQFRAASLGAVPTAQDRLPSVTNYYLGNDPKKWHAGVPHFGRVTYSQVYPGIDVVYYGNEKKLEYDFIVAPGADPSRIRIAFTGADSIKVDRSGDLVLTVHGRELRQKKPVIYQQLGDRRIELAGTYQLSGSNEVQLALASYDARRPLVIDPVFEYSTYFGYNQTDAGTAVAVDSAGASYITGFTQGLLRQNNSPAPVRAYSSLSDAFAAKFTPAGALAYYTYLGGTLSDGGTGIAVDSSGSAYVTGNTSGSNYPIVLASQGLFGGAQDAFVTKLGPTGAILFSTYLGGAGTDSAGGIAVDSTGNVFIGGSTTGGLPVVNAQQATFAGGSSDAFSAKLNASGIPIYLTYLGGSGDDGANAIAVDSTGNAYLTGYATTGFPVLNAFQRTAGSQFQTDAFVTKLDSTGVRVYSTFLGGSSTDVARGIAVDYDGSAYVCGLTYGPFPTRNANRSSPGGSLATPGVPNSSDTDGFVTKFGPSGVMVYSTYVGDIRTDECNAIAVDVTGAAYITGSTNARFPAGDTPQPTYGGGSPSANDDGFIMKFNPAGGVVYSSFIGGINVDFGAGIAVDSIGGAYVTGMARTGFPTVSAAQSTYGGNNDAFLSKIAAAAQISTARLISMSLNTVVAGDPSFTLTLTGTGFNPAATIAWNSNLVLSVGSITATTAQVSIPASFFATPGVASLTLTNPGQTASNALLMNIVTPPCSFGITTDLTSTIPPEGKNIAQFSVSTGQFCNWSLETPVPWIQFNLFSTNPFSGTGSGTFFPLVAANPNPASRSAVLTLTGDGAPAQQFIVNQTGFVCQIGLTPTSAARGPAASTGSFVIGASASGCPWTISSSASWLTITSPSTGTGSATINYAYTANPSPFSRSATITVNDRVITLTQQGTNPCANFSLSHVIQAFPANGGSGLVVVAAEGACPWTATSNASWVTVTTGSTGVGTGAVTFTVQSNPAFASRSALLTIAGQSFVITQAGASFTQSCSLATTPVNISAEGRTEAVANITINCTGLSQSIAADLELTLNTAVTNRLVGGLADATLTGAGAPRNAQVSGYNLLRWTGLVLGPGTVTLQITNVRVDASLFGVPSNLTAVPVTARVNFNAAYGLPVSNSVATVAQVRPGIIVQPGVPAIPVPGAAAYFPVVFREGYNSAFRATAAGDAGTRLRVVLSNLPAGISISAPVAPLEGASRARLLSADSAGAGGTPITGISNQPLTITAGSASATWELLVVDNSATEFLTFPLLIQNATPGQLTSISLDTRGSFAPVSSLSLPSASAPLPRYRDLAVPQRRVDLRLRSFVEAVTAPGATNSAAKASSGSSRALGNFAPNAEVRFVQTLTTGDTTANNVVIRNNLPTGLILRSCSVACTQEGSQVVITVPTLPPGSTQSYAVTTQIGPELANGGVVSNTSTVSSDDPAIDLDATIAATSIDVVLPPPSVTLPTPISGSGLSRTFVLTFTNPNGFNQFDVVNALINQALDGGSACYIAYSWPTRSLFLVDNIGLGGGVSSPLTLGVAGSVTNSQCTINGTGSSAVGSGNVLTLTLSITFKPAFAGNRVVYLAARAVNGTNSGWSTAGFHEVPGAATSFPNPVGVTPAAGNTATALTTFLYDDQTNANNLQTVWGLVNTAVDARAACYFAYFVPGNLLLLFPDNGDGAAVTVTPLSGSGFVENSQCRINAQGSSAVRSGARLTLNLNMTYKPPFAGGKAIWMALQTLAAQTSPWKVSGAWQVPQ